LTPEEKAVAARQRERTNMQIAVGAGVALLAGLSKMLLDLTNLRTKRVRPAQSPSDQQPMTVESFRKLTQPGIEGDWAYHPPSAKQ
jgi:hypothetical protein